MDVIFNTSTQALQRHPRLTTISATLGALWLSSKALSLLNFTYLHFLRPSSLLKYQHPLHPSSPSPKTTWALITGASDGIGRGFAEELSSRGFNIILHGRNAQKLAKVRADLLSQTPTIQIRIFLFDATNSIADLEAAAKDELQHLDIAILINNIAAGQRPFWTPLAENTAQRIGLSMDVDARFMVEMTRILLPQLTQRGRGLVLSVGSLASEAPCPYASVVSGTKAFGKAWSRSLGFEMRADGHAGVEVMHVLVGVVATPNEARTESFLVPNPRQMAKASLDKVGCGRDVVVGYWPHALQYFVLTELPAWVGERMIMAIAKEERAKEEKMLRKI